MKTNKNRFAKKIKSKNWISNILLTLNVILGTIPLLLVVLLVEMLMRKEMTMEKLFLISGGITVCLVFKALFYGLSIWKAHEAAYGILTDIRSAMIDHMKKLPLGFFQKRKTGDLTNIINHDVEQVELYLAHALPEIVSATLVPAVIVVVLAVFDWRLALALVCTAPLMVLARKILNRFWSGNIQHYLDSTKKMSEDLLEYIATIPVIKAFSREEQKTRSVLDGMEDYLGWVRRMLIGISLPMSFVAMMLEGGLVVMIIVGSHLFSNGQIVLWEFVLALILGGVFSSSFAKLATFQHYGIVFNRSLDSIGSVMNETPPFRKQSGDGVSTGSVVFNDVNFSYEKGKQVLSDINLTFRENSIHALVGSSGSGKSTLASLLMGFWQPDSGVISIGGININQMSESELSSLVSIVQQEVFLFNLSIEENIRIGKQDATEEEIIMAAKRAQVHDFIMNLPRGYDTLAGEAGVKFSGGEKQRISIARVMLKNTPIIILDEATAAIDPNNEYLIQEAIGNLAENKTLIMIAHHLNTIENADQIVVMEDGKVVAFGKHEQLLTTCPLYSDMVEHQNKVDTWQIKEVGNG